MLTVRLFLKFISKNWKFILWKTKDCPCCSSLSADRWPYDDIENFLYYKKVEKFPNRPKYNTLWILKTPIKMSEPWVKVLYFVFDGAFGHNDALQMVRQLGLHLISKLRHDAALYFPYEGPYAGRGKRKKYGKKLDCQHIPNDYLKEDFVDKDIRTRIYHITHGSLIFIEVFKIL